MMLLHSISDLLGVNLYISKLPSLSVIRMSPSSSSILTTCTGDSPGLNSASLGPDNVEESTNTVFVLTLFSMSLSDPFSIRTLILSSIGPVWFGVKGNEIVLCEPPRIRGRVADPTCSHPLSVFISKRPSTPVASCDPRLSTLDWTTAGSFGLGMGLETVDA